MPGTPAYRTLFRALLFAQVILALATAAWAVGQAFERPPDYPEACVLFNAARLREGKKLYVAPIDGAREYGEPRARYFVAYTPFYAGLLSLVPARHALPFARLLGFVAWSAALAMCVRAAFRRSRSPGDGSPGATHLRDGVLAALSVGSLFLFARWSACAKPDGIALCVVALALHRMLDLGRVDIRVGALFALAALIKPSVVGMGLGVLGSSLLLDGAAGVAGAAGAGLVLAAGLVPLQVLSGGVALTHLEAAVALSFDAHQLVRQVASRVPFVAGVWVAASVALLTPAGLWGARPAQAEHERFARIFLMGLWTSIAVSSFALGKRGATINYLMEPALVSVVVLGRWSLPLPLRRGPRVMLSAVLGVSMLWGAHATLRSLVHEHTVWGASTSAFERIRTRCLGAPGAFVVSDDPGIELALNGRIYTHAVELSHEVERGRFPAATWAADMASPDISCVVTFVGDERPPARVALGFPPAVDEVLRRRFILATVDAGYAVYAMTPR